MALESARLRAAGFRHGFSTRRLDFKPLTEAALDAIGLALRLDAARVHVASQVHGARVVVAGDDPAATSREEADAVVAPTSGAVVGVRVADCVPVLFADTRTGRVAAAHAGWRGLVAGVLEATLATGAALGARFDVAAIGPCIGPCCFEVGADVAAEIAGTRDAAVVVRRAGDKAWVDLRAAVRARLERAGGIDVDDVAGCTKCDPERFFSHRRDGASAGRHLALIAAR